MIQSSDFREVVYWQRYHPKHGRIEQFAVSSYFGMGYKDLRYFRKDQTPRTSIKIRGNTYYLKLVL